MRIYALWYGGCSYAPPKYRDLEEFDTLMEAKWAFEARADYDPYFPCVDQEETCMWIWAKKAPADDGQLYPQGIISLGKRGGVHVDWNV